MIALTNTDVTLSALDLTCRLRAAGGVENSQGRLHAKYRTALYIS